MFIEIVIQIHALFQNIRSYLSKFNWMRDFFHYLETLSFKDRIKDEQKLL